MGTFVIALGAQLGGGGVGDETGEFVVIVVVFNTLLSLTGNSGRKSSAIHSCHCVCSVFVCRPMASTVWDF